MEPIAAVNEGEGQKTIAKAETGVEEGRKRKRDEKKYKEQSSGEEIEDFLSDRAYKIMEKNILKKEFIGDKGFKEFISPFKEIIENRGCNIISTCHLGMH